MARAKRVAYADGTPYGIRIECPGCGRPHVIKTAPPDGWAWNGSLERPTISPSLLCTWTEGEAKAPRRCHTFIKDGRIEYLGDCLHALAGHTVDLPEIPRR